MRPTTKLVFIETPSNPLTEVFDIVALAGVAHAAGALLVVDNCFCTPALQRPLEMGADLVIHSATKYLDGQGRVLGGAVCGAKAPAEEIFKFLRTAGPSLSPFNAWVILKGLETLSVRMKAQSDNALEMARWLEAQPQVARVFYPGPGFASATRAGDAAAVQRRRHRLLRGQGRARGGVARGGQLPAAVDYRQPGRHQDHHHASGIDHPWPHHARKPGLRRA
jgi:cystathionine beta-lyase/cystathionine gamma-synthase